MSRLITRKDLRESARHKLGKRTAIDDTPPGILGDPSTSQANPTNWVINRQIEESISMLNLRGNFFVSQQPEQFPFSAQASSTLGPMAISMYTGTGGLNSVMSAWITDTSGNFYPLSYTSAYELGRDRKTYPNIAPSTPTHLFVEGYQMWLNPAPSFAGTLFIRAGVGITSPQNDDEPVSQLSPDEAQGLGTIVAAALAEQEIDDQVTASRSRYLGPAAQDWTNMIIASVARRNLSFVPGYSVRTLRVQAGRRTR